MLIRSQNKKSLINMDNVARLTVKKIYGKEETGWLIKMDKSSFTGCLGEYSTKERAIKALDLICEFADSKHYERVVPEKCGRIDGAVFQMPQDSEV